MSTWFECKVKYQKTDQNGVEKMVNELYLVDAMSFTEAEARITKELQAYITGEFNLTNLKMAGFSEMITSETGDRWFKCKVAIISIDEAKGVERKVTTNMLVNALNVKDAFERIEDYMQSSVNEYRVSSITESAIMDVFPVHEDEEMEDKEISRVKIEDDFENE
jgi:phage terminase small subunit